MSEIRLIDANKLKYKNLAEVNGRLTYVLTAEDIDNAPTVEDCSLEIARKSLELGRRIGKLEGKGERPHGEWIIIADVYCKCPFCSNVEVKFSKYCPECGARLEGGTE